MNIISGFPESSECLRIRLPPVVDEYYYFGLNCWFQVGNAGFKPIRIPPFSFAEAQGVHGRVVDGVTDVITPLLSVAGRAVFEGVVGVEGGTVEAACDK